MLALAPVQQYGGLICSQGAGRLHPEPGHAGLHREVRDPHGPVGIGKSIIVQASSE